jgi:hypothetical protein
MSVFKKELEYESYEQLSNSSNFDFKNVNFNNTSICNTLLKMYDQGCLYLSKGDEERAYILLLRFFEAFLKLKDSKIYKNDRKFCDSLITPEKLEKAICSLESIKKSLLSRYAEREKAKLVANNKDSNSNSTTELSTELSTFNLNQISSLNNKKFLASKDLTDFIRKNDFTYLIIDTRNKIDYDYSHMNLSILLSDNLKKQSSIAYLNLPHDSIQNVAWKMEDSLKNNDSFAYDLFAKRFINNKKKC